MRFTHRRNFVEKKCLHQNRHTLRMWVCVHPQQIFACSSSLSLAPSQAVTFFITSEKSHSFLPLLSFSRTASFPLATSTQWGHMYSLRSACAVAFNYGRCQLTQKAPSFLSRLRISSRAPLFHGTICGKKKTSHQLGWNNQKKEPT